MTAGSEIQVENRDRTNSAASSRSVKRQARRLAEFYSGKCVLLTGCTGFIGKVCLVKLMTALSGIERIYVLLRAKKGLAPEQRLARLLTEEPFCSARDASGGPLDWTKVRALDGDMSKPELGLSEESLAELRRNVQVVINLAASVQFDAPLKQNLRDNYLGASNLLSLSCSFEHLISLVHVSTFYTNSHMSHIEERVEPLNRDCEQLAKLIEWLPEDMCNNPSAELLEQRPNTYVITKAMAENLVKKYEGRLPTAIVRPSIVLPSAKDPTPGWVDNVNGPMGLGVLASLGILRNIDWNYWGVADMIPVDHVANSVLAIAERTARLYPKEIRVYNCSSSSLKPVTWGEMFEILREESLKAPPYKMLRIPILPPQHKRAGKVGWEFSKLSELLFAYMIDFLLVLCGQKRLLVKLTSKLHHGYEILRPFTTTEYTCANDNLVAAYDEMHPEDRENFDFDVRCIKWGDLFRISYLGSRKRLLKEDISNLPSARLKMYVLSAFETILRLLFVVSVGYMSWRLVRAYALPTAIQTS